MAEITASPARDLTQLRYDVLAWARAHSEVLTLGGIMLFAFVLRLWGLDERSIHHDESLHTQYSWYIEQGRGFIHDPLMHGPLRFEAVAVVYFLFGDSDFSSRLLPAIFGTALVGMPYFLRRQIGMPAVFIAAVLLSLSPTLLYVSRFIRDDIFVAVWVMALVICVWRYLEEQKNLYLYIFAAVLALSFATMEITFIYAAILLVFLDAMFAIDLANRREDERDISFVRRALVLLPVAWLIAAAWPFLGKQPFGREKLTPTGDLLLLLGTLTLPHFAAGIQVLPFVGDDGYRAQSEANLTVITVTSLMVASAYVGVLWKPRVWGIAAACFFVPYVFTMTTFLTNQPPLWDSDFWQAQGGFWSGMWGSLDYWLAQHGVNRGSQPDHYYLLVTPVYEFLALAVAIAGSLWFAVRRRVSQPWVLPVVAFAALLWVLADEVPGLPASYFRLLLPLVLALGVALADRIPSIERWFFFWAVCIFMGLSIAGEKMPWLDMHVALPLALLAAVILAKGLKDVPVDWHAWAPSLVVAALAAGAVLLVVEAGDRDLLRYLAFGLALAAFALAGSELVQRRQRGFVTAVAAGGLGLLLALSIRTAFMAAYENDRAELLVYAQASQDVGRLSDRVDALAERSGLGFNLPVVVDKELTWPWAWYLRHYHDVTYVDFTAGSFTPKEGSVVLISAGHASLITPAGYDQEPHRHYLWFPQPYLDLTMDNALSTLTSKDGLDGLLDYFLYRYPTERYLDSQAVAFFPNSLAAYDAQRRPVEPPPEPIVRPDGRITISEMGTSPGRLLQPTDVFVDRQGNIWVADSRNNRVQKFDSTGRYVTSIGSGGSAEGQLNEPWGVVVDADGSVYVADTWNYRIQKFSPDGTFVKAWGEPANLPSPAPTQFYGPRDLVIRADGTLWLTDTGHKRVVGFTLDGEPVTSFGTEGTALGQFREPVGLAVDAQGRLYVADTWNSRIQRFDPGFTAPVAFSVGWSSQDVLAKPYIAVLTDGRIVAGDPERGRLVLLAGDGRQLGTWTPQPGSLPLGVAALPDGGFVFADGKQNQVEVVPGNLIDELFR